MLPLSVELLHLHALYYPEKNRHPSAPTNPIDTSIQKKTNITLPFTIKATKKEYSFRII
jgi:hypothetical protein